MRRSLRVNIVTHIIPGIVQRATEVGFDKSRVGSEVQVLIGRIIIKINRGDTVTQ